MLRPAVPGDGPDVAALLDELGYPCTPAEAAERIATLAGEPDQVLLVADIEGIARGLLALHFLYSLTLGSDTCRITALIVAAGYRGHGLGRALLREAERLARRDGAVRIEVTTARGRVEGNEAYRAAGFEETGLRFVKRLGEA
ncbi:MAG TPA: GNAT family N-acetyltransferase [Xanthomonadaceae bacterium]|nr:GNAT family N-acetyltransferase [Xanthomonadaceae bacterium]